MAVQIIGLRDYYNEKLQKMTKKEAFFDKMWRADSVPLLFANIDQYISAIPDDERYNLYYTAASCLEKRGRVLEYQTIIPFDVDDIDTSRYEEYIKCFQVAYGVPMDSVGTVLTGNGLQFIVETNTPINYDEYFDEHRLYYKAVCDRLSTVLRRAELKGTVDACVFSKSRLLRLPNTKNIKPEKGEKDAKMLQPNITPIDFDIIELSGIPQVPYDGQMADAFLERLPPPDPEGVLNGCDFIKWCKTDAPAVSEPQWYAMLSILSRLEDGKAVCHEYSRGNPQYNDRETDAKIEQSLRASGPRTCENISYLWDGCGECPNQGKCKSPIMLVSANHIKTRDTGFYNIVLTKDGEPKKGKPNYDDLMKYFDKEQPFVTMATSNITFIHKDGYWQDYSPKKLDWFAEQHFDPTPNNAMCTEFRGKIQRNHLQNPEWFQTEGMINFANGVLDLETMELSARTKDQGFRYVLPFDYDPSAECPRFDMFMEEVCCGDKSLQSILIEFMGYSLSAIDPSIGQKALLLLGDGSNGKSVFMDLLKYLAGKNNYATLSMGHEISKLENRYQLDGKLFNISEETPSNSMMDNSIFKALVSGGEVQARKLYCDSYSMKNNAKIILACNSLPDTQDLSHGMFRRLLIIPFNNKFKETDKSYDPMIRDKLFAEAAGIYNKVLAGLIRFKTTQRFSDSTTVNKAIESYKTMNSPVQEFWEDNMTAHNTGEVGLDEVYLQYKVFCEMTGNKTKQRNVFTREIRPVLHDDAKFYRKRVDGKLATFITGYKLPDDDNF